MERISRSQSHWQNDDSSVPFDSEVRSGRQQRGQANFEIETLGRREADQRGRSRRGHMEPVTMQDEGAPNDGPEVAAGPAAASAQSAGALPAALTGPPALWLFTLTTFVSALLLFSIQPLFAKMVLPVLGGSPSVWAVALCFFQGALLAGYCYAHLIIRLIGARARGFVHLLVCLAAI